MWAKKGAMARDGDDKQILGALAFKGWPEEEDLARHPRPNSLFPGSGLDPGPWAQACSDALCPQKRSDLGESPPTSPEAGPGSCFPLYLLVETPMA